MTTYVIRLTVFTVLFCAQNTSFAEDAAELISGEPAYINLRIDNIRIEIPGLEEATKNFSMSSEELSRVLKKLADREDLTNEERDMIHSMVLGVNQASEDILNLSERLPELLQSSRLPILDIADDLALRVTDTSGTLLNRIELLLVIFGIVIIVIISLSFYLFYRLAIRPGKQVVLAIRDTSVQFNELSKRMENITCELQNTLRESRASDES